MPLNLHKAAGLLVIGTVRHGLRLTALVLRGVSIFCWRGSAQFLKGQAARHRKSDLLLPSRGRQAKSDKIPAADQMPKGHGNSVAAQYQLQCRPIRQIGVRGVPGALLGTFSALEKYPARGCGNPQTKRLITGDPEAPSSDKIPPPECGQPPYRLHLDKYPYGCRNRPVFLWEIVHFFSVGC